MGVCCGAADRRGKRIYNRCSLLAAGVADSRPYNKPCGGGEIMEGNSCYKAGLPVGAGGSGNVACSAPYRTAHGTGDNRHYRRCFLALVVPGVSSHCKGAYVAGQSAR